MESNETVPVGASRTVHRYKMPASVDTTITSIGLVELTTAEELRATKRAKTDAGRMAYELAKQSLLEIDDKVVSEADGTKDKSWDAMSPKVRALVLMAYSALHTPEDEETDSFLNSQTITTG